MELTDGMKEVYFNQYCQTCKWKDEAETGEHCDECLAEPVNQNSHKPVRWEEK